MDWHYSRVDHLVAGASCIFAVGCSRVKKVSLFLTVPMRPMQAPTARRSIWALQMNGYWMSPGLHCWLCQTLILTPPDRTRTLRRFQVQIQA
jgi:hypothetical protein